MQNFVSYGLLHMHKLVDYRLPVNFYPRDAMHREGVCDSDVSGWLSGRLSVHYSRYCIKTERASIMISSPSDSPIMQASREV